MLNWDKYTFNGMLSSEPHPNFNMVGSTSLGIMLADKHTAGDFYTALRNYLNDTNRNPSIDDYICLVGVGMYEARLVLTQGQKHFWIFDIEEMEYPRKFKRWFIRFPAFIAHTYYGARLKPNPFLRLCWAIAMYFGATAKSQDAIIQSWVMRVTYERSQFKTLLCDLAAKYYDSKPRDLNQTYLDYCQLPDHPLVGAFPK